MSKQIAVQDATPETVAPYGALIGAAIGASRRTLFYDSAVELFEAPVFHSDADTCLAVARIHPRPGEIKFLERHFKHTQAFLPLSGAPYVVVLAPPTPGRDVPDPADIRAFRFRGDQGFLMHVGTWHEFPFAVDAALDMVVVLRNETNRDLEAIQNGEAVGEDLEKRNVSQRFGVTLSLAHG